MKTDSIVLEEAPAVALYSPKSEKKWCGQMLVFPNTHKTAILGSFLTSGRPNGTPPLVFKLREPFEVKLYKDNSITDDFSSVENALKELFEQLKNKRPKNSVMFSLSRKRSHNLPGARCDKFIKRPLIEQSFLKAIHSEKPVVWVYGEDGSGKAEMLRHVLVESIKHLPFEAIVWIDVKPNDSVEALDVPQLLAVLGRELEIPKLLPTTKKTDLNLAVKELSRDRVLIVLQHYEALDSPTVFHWLRSLQNSKAVVLSCQSPQPYQTDWSREVRVPPMAPNERDEFLNLCLNIGDGNLLILSKDERELLFEVTGANPVRIAKAVSLLRHGGNLRDMQGPTFLNEVGPASFQRFNAHSQRCLLALSLFPYGAYSGEIAEITQLTEEQIQVALFPLAGFVEVCHGATMMDASRRLLADAGTGYWLRQHHKDNPELLGMKDRWYLHFEELAKNIGFCWDAVEKLRILDAPGMADTLRYVLRQAMIEKRYTSAIRIGRDCRYWQYVRGDWISKWSPIKTWENAARAHEDTGELFDALVYQFNIRSKQAMHSKEALEEVTALAKDIKTLLRTVRPTKVSNDRYMHALSLWEMARGRLASAVRRWKTCLHSRLEPHERSAIQRWLAACLRRQKKPSEARKVFLRHLANVDGKYERSALMTHLNLVEMDLDDKKTKDACTRLENISERIIALEDRSFCADYEFLTAKCHLNMSEQEDARAALQRARDHYERLGKDARVSEIEQILGGPLF